MNRIFSKKIAGTITGLIWLLSISVTSPVTASTFAYVVNTGSNDVSVINTATNTAVNTITMSDYPVAVAVTPDGSHVYVTNYNGYVSVIDATTNMVVKNITVGSYPLNLAITMNGTRVYVANRYSNTVSVIDTTTNTVVGTISGGPGGLQV